MGDRIVFDLMPLTGGIGAGISPSYARRNKVQTFNFYSDPGHGWLAVPRALLVELGIEEKITSYSYQRLDEVFLEEDGDYTTFFLAMTAADREFKVFEINTPRSDSFVRSLQSYRCEVTK